MINRLFEECQTTAKDSSITDTDNFGLSFVVGSYGKKQPRSPATPQYSDGVAASNTADVITTLFSSYQMSSDSRI